MTDFIHIYKIISELTNVCCCGFVGKRSCSFAKRLVNAFMDANQLSGSHFVRRFVYIPTIAFLTPLLLCAPLCSGDHDVNIHTSRIWCGFQTNILTALTDEHTNLFHICGNNIFFVQAWVHIISAHILHHLSDYWNCKGKTQTLCVLACTHTMQKSELQRLWINWSEPLFCCFFLSFTVDHHAHHLSSLSPSSFSVSPISLLLVIWKILKWLFVIIIIIILNGICAVALKYTICYMQYSV